MEKIDFSPCSICGREFDSEFINRYDMRYCINCGQALNDDEIKRKANFVHSSLFNLLSTINEDVAGLVYSYDKVSKEEFCTIFYASGGKKKIKVTHCGLQMIALAVIVAL